MKKYSPPTSKKVELFHKVVRGFTLIEVLITIGIIGAMVGIVTVTFPASQVRARDIARKSDIKQFQNALELYANSNNGLYPIEETGVPADILCGTLGLVNCPVDDRAGQECGNGTCGYVYMTDATGLSYTIDAVLEKPPSTGLSWQGCSTGEVGDAGQLPVDGTCTVGSVYTPDSPTPTTSSTNTPTPTSAFTNTPTPTSGLAQCQGACTTNADCDPSLVCARNTCVNNSCRADLDCICGN